MQKHIMIVALMLSVSACAAPQKTSKHDEFSVSTMLDEAATRGIEATNTTAVTTRKVPLVQRVGADSLPDAGNGASSGGTDMTAAGLVPPPESVQPVSARWNGEVEGLINHLAARAEYAVRVTGTKPAVPMTVAVVAHEEPLRSVLARTAAMTSGYARISMDEASKIINIRYVR